MYTFELSVQGARHRAAGTPCQDSSGTRSLTVPGLGRCVCLAVADGLSSAPRSEQGAAAAVQAFGDRVTNELQALQTDFLDLGQEQREQELLDIARGGVESGLAAVVKLANQEKRPVSDYDTTLCAAVLCESGLAAAVNIGDSGCVALFDDGTYKFVTRRDKGTEANSVYPLRCTEKWSGQSLHGVVGLVLATDGILDLFVSDAATSNMVFWPFAEQILRPLSSQADVTALRAGWDDLLKGQVKYYKDLTLREVVEDDLTIAVAAADAEPVQNALKRVAWQGAEAFRQELHARRRRAWPGLYGGESAPASEGGGASTANATKNRAQNNGKPNKGKQNNDKPNRMRKRKPHAQAKPPEGPRKGG